MSSAEPAPATVLAGGIAAQGAALNVNGNIFGNGGTNGALVIQSSQFNINEYPVPGYVFLTAGSTYNGSTTINGVYTTAASPLTVTLQGAGTIANSQQVTLNSAQLTLDDSVPGATAGRLDSVGTLTLNGSVLQYNGSGSANSTQVIGFVNLNSGFDQVRVANTSAGNVVLLNSTFFPLQRSNNAVVAFDGSTLGGATTAVDQIKFQSTPTLVGNGGGAGTASISIIPWAIGESNTANNNAGWGFVTYDGNGIRPLAAGEYATTALATAGQNARDVTAATTAITANANAINGWVIDNNNTTSVVTLTGSVLLNGSSGFAPVLFASTNGNTGTTLNGGTLNFGTNEAILTVATTGGATISSTLTNTTGGSLTVSGFGTLNISGATVSGLSGTLTVNGNELVIGSSLGAIANIQLGGGVQAVGGSTTTGGGFIKFNAAGTTLTQTVTLEPGAFAGFDGGANSGAVSGLVSGSGNLVQIGGNTLTLSNTGNSYSGQTYVYQGTLVTTTGAGQYLQLRHERHLYRSRHGRQRPVFRCDHRSRLRHRHGHRQHGDHQLRRLQRRHLRPDQCHGRGQQLRWRHHDQRQYNAARQHHQLAGRDQHQHGQRHPLDRLDLQSELRRHIPRSLDRARQCDDHQHRR